MPEVEPLWSDGSPTPGCRDQVFSDSEVLRQDARKRCGDAPITREAILRWAKAGRLRR